MSMSVEQALEQASGTGRAQVGPTFVAWEVVSEIIQARSVLADAYREKCEEAAEWKREAERLRKDIEVRFMP